MSLKRRQCNPAFTGICNENYRRHPVTRGVSLWNAAKAASHLQAYAMRTTANAAALGCMSLKCCQCRHTFTDVFNNWHVVFLNPTHQPTFRDALTWGMDRKLISVFCVFLCLLFSSFFPDFHFTCHMHSMKSFNFWSFTGQNRTYGIQNQHKQSPCALIVYM